MKGGHGQTNQSHDIIEIHTTVHISWTTIIILYAYVLCLCTCMQVHVTTDHDNIEKIIMYINYHCSDENRNH